MEGKNPNLASQLKYISSCEVSQDSQGFTLKIAASLCSVLSVSVLSYGRGEAAHLYCGFKKLDKTFFFDFFCVF